METTIQQQSAQVMSVFARNMKRIRHEKKRTQEWLAEAAGLHPTYISSVERGRRNVSIGCIERIARALDVPMWELLVEQTS